MRLLRCVVLTASLVQTGAGVCRCWQVTDLMFTASLLTLFPEMSKFSHFLSPLH